MSRPRCPGQDMRQWKPEDIFDVKCPWCDWEIEFWKDEPSRVCDSCGREIRNPRIDLGCAKWCKFVTDCLGDTVTDAEVDTSFYHRLIFQMREALGQDPKQIEHSAQVLANAECILEHEGGDALVVRAAAILMSVESPRTTRSILEKLGVPAAVVEQIFQIRSSLDTGEIDTHASRIVHDAERLVRISDEYATAGKDREELTELIERLLHTPKGRELAERRLLGPAGGTVP